MNPQLEHANLSVKSIDETVAFLTAAMPEVRVRGQGRDGARRWLHIGTDETYISLNQNEAEPIEKMGHGFNHLGFIVDDAQAVRDRLLLAGYVESYTTDPHPHRERVYFRDRNGMEWEFVSYGTEDPAKRNSYS